MKLELLTDYVGKKVSSIFFLVHSIGNEFDDAHPTEICFECESEVLLTLKCANDGQSIAVSGKRPLEVNMDELGCNKLINVPINSALNKIEGSRITDMQKIYSGYSNSTLGIKIITDNVTSNVLNLGDELFIFSEVPQDIVAEEEITYRQLSE